MAMVPVFVGHEIWKRKATLGIEVHIETYGEKFYMYWKMKGIGDIKEETR